MNHDCKIKAVIFDMYETLITHYACPLYFSEEMALDAGIDPKLFREQWRPSEHDRSVGKVTVDQIVTDILKKNGCYSERLLEAIMKKRIRTKELCFEHLQPEIIPMLDGLKEQGIGIGLISNCFSEEAEVIRRSILFPYFDGAFLSYEQGMEKPDARIYLRCMEKLGVKPEECLYVGDGGSQELEAARSLGMETGQALWYLTEKSRHRIQKKEGFRQLMRPMEVLEIVAEAGTKWNTKTSTKIERILKNQGGQE